MQSTLIPGILMLSAIGLVFLVLHCFRLYQKKRKRPSPFTRDLLRGPGQSSLKQIDELNDVSKICFFALGIFPVVIFAAHSAYTHYSQSPESWPRAASSVVIALAFMGYYLRKLLQLLARRRICRLAYDGEVAVGQALNQLLADGYQVFHDFAADEFNIDHIVVGATGVMAVETMARCKGRSHNRGGDAVVAYDGRMLHFPKFSDYETIDQAKRQAEWLSQWLSSAVGEDVCARAMVAIPGWAVKRTSADGISVVNPKQFGTLFKYIRPRPISDCLMQRIINLIEGRCRDDEIQKPS